MVWQVGQVVEGLYRVEGILGQGGMGVVHRVRHLGWDVDLAVKCPLPGQFDQAVDRHRFIQEAEAWVALGLHPNLCACHYVRSFDGVPHVFAELVNGGSLRDWIVSGRLYEGTPTQSLARIIDLAIQAAWGLGHAHELGMVHQDVKPANLLVTDEGVAKVADFGLTRARRGGPALAAELAVLMSDTPATLRVWSEGFSPAYASPEQASGSLIGRRSDLWSFAVSVLEMLVGAVTWGSGPAAAMTVDDLRTADGRRRAMVPPPPALIELLGWCLRHNPAERPGSLDDVADFLIVILSDTTGADHRRVPPHAANLRADQLNNQALSLLDLGRTEEAFSSFNDALRLDRQHPEALYNSGLSAWRAGIATDTEVVAELAGAVIDSGHALPLRCLLAHLHLEQGDPDAALAVLGDEVAADESDPGTMATAAALRGLARSGRHRLSEPVPAASAVKVRVRPRLPRTRRSPDGRWELSADSEGVLRLRDTVDDRLVAAFDAHDGGVEALELGVDGRWAVSRGEASVRVWELPVARLHHDEDGRCLAGDGQVALCGRRDGTIAVWDLRTGRRRHTLLAHTADVASLCLSPDGQFALSTSENGGTARVWDLATGACVNHLYGPTTSRRIKALALTEGGTIAITADQGGGLEVWDVASGRLRRSLRGHTLPVRSVDIIAEGRLALSATRSGEVRVWDLQAGRCLQTLHGCDLADGPEPLTVADDRTVRRWQWPLEPYLAPLQLCRPVSHAELTADEARVRSLVTSAERALDEGDHRAAAARLRQIAHITGWERSREALAAHHRLALRSARVGLSAAWDRGVLGAHPRAVTTLAVSADGSVAASGGADGTVRLWDLSSGTCLQVLAGHSSTVAAVALSRDGSLVISGANKHLISPLTDDTVRVWDASTGRCLRVLSGHDRWVGSVALAANGRQAVSAGVHRDQHGADQRSVRVWDLTNGHCERELPARNITSVWISPNGDRAISPEQVWDVASGRCIMDDKRPAGVEREAVAPDGSVVYTDLAVWRRWDPTTGERRELVRVPPVPRTGSMSMALSSDGRFALSATGSVTGGNEVTIWNLDAGRPLRTLTGHLAVITAVAFTPDGSRVLAAARDGTIRQWEIVWDLETREGNDVPPEARPLLEQFLAARAFRTAEEGQQWDDNEFEHLLYALGCAGYGWIPPVAVQAELVRMAASRP